MRSTRHLALIAAALLLSLSCLPARAGVDVEIDPNAKISSELAEGETETFRFTVPRGSVLTFSLAAKKKAPLDFVVALDVDAGEAPGFGEAKKFKDQGTKFQVKGLVLPSNGEYTLTVSSATGAGEYALKLKAVPQKKWSETVSLGASATEEVAFAGPGSSAVTLKARAAKGSAADPRFGDFEGQDLSAEGKAKAGSHIVKATGPDQGGKLTVEITDVGGTGGDVSFSAVVKAPKVKTQKLDIRPAALGEDSGDESILAKTVDAENGGVVVVADGSGIDGAAVSIDPGALAGDTRVTVSSIDAPGEVPGGSQAGGPAVQFGPEGLQFSSPADVTLPYDPSMLAAGTDAGTDLTVLRTGADGSTETLPVSSVNTGDNTVTAETDGFSTFVVLGPEGTPNIEGDEYWVLFVEFDLVPDGAADDSRDRQVSHGYGSISFGAPGVANDLSWRIVNRDIEWTHDDDGVATVTGTDDGLLPVETGTWDYGADGQSIAIEDADEPGEFDAFALSKDGRFVTGLGTNEPGETGTNLDVFIRKPDEPLTADDIVGTYWFGGMDGGFFDDGGNGPICIEYEDGFGTVTFRADGTVKTDITYFFTDFDGPGGAQESFLERDRSTGSWSFDTDAGPLLGSLVLEFPDDDGPTFVRMLPGEKGDVLIGAEDSFDENDAGFNVFVLVRQGAGGLSRADLDETYVAAGVDFGPTTYDVPSFSPVPDFETCQIEALLPFTGGSTVTPTDAVFRLVARYPGVPGGVEVDIDGPGTDLPITFSLSGTGKFSGSDAEGQLVGAVAPDLAFGFLTDEPRDRSEFATLTIFFDRPPRNSQ